MSRILIGVCISLVLVMTVPGYAGNGVVGNWEGTTGDGWIMYSSGKTISSINPPSTISGITFGQSTIGATNGNYALTVSGVWGWGQQLECTSYLQTVDPTAAADFLNNTKFQIDVTYNSAVWSPSDYAQVYELSMDGTGLGWTDVGGSNSPTGAGGVTFTDSLNPGAPGQLPMTNAGTPGTIYTGTWTWDYSALLAQMKNAGMTATNGYVNFIFALNGNDGNGDFYFDNARFTPEPVTLALLGLGGLALIRRKR